MALFVRLIFGTLFALYRLLVIVLVRFGTAFLLLFKKV